MKEQPESLALFDPLIRKWFVERLGTPTDIQVKAWPEIAKGSHALMTAPTGSGKTLTAFLWAINQLITGAWHAGQTRVLYVSPLKALNNDIRLNLITPLEELAVYFREAGRTIPNINILTRSGDTPAEERRQMLKTPPEILITTPESLNIMLSSQSGLHLLTGMATVILDEVHAVIGTKRGTHLMAAVERITRLAGEFQRLALSATVKPVEKVAEFVGGYRIQGDARAPHYGKREVRIIRSADEKRYAIDVRFPPDAREKLENGSWWPALVESFKEIIKAHRSTLLFVNARRTAEKVTRFINENEPEELAYAHHGSLSREIRLAVEQRLKKGELKAIVATSSLELGIDIGDLDRVILIETPPSISSAIQRVGRSGHHVGSTSRGLLYPIHGRDFLNAAIIAKSVVEQDIEPVYPIEAPLDVLAQIVISMVGVESWDIDELFVFVKTSYAYRNLSRRQFDLVLAMLAGRYAETRLRELKTRIYLDKVDNTVRGREGIERLIYLSGGTIPDRGYYDMRIEESHAKVGELDEEFVWERKIGDTFAFGTNVWQIRRITDNDVEVVPTGAIPGIIPFWRAEEMSRDFYFSEKILLFLERVNERLGDTSLREELLREYFLDETAADELIAYLKRQREATGADLPHRHHLLIEHFKDPLNQSGTKQVILHTLWGAQINMPFALALQAAWEEKFRYHIEVIENDDCLVLMLSHEFSADDIFSLVTPEKLERLIRASLEKSGFFGARFRENAGRALLLPRMHFKKRVPLWLNRLRARKLMDAVLQYPDFPILLESWRTCLQDEFDLERLRQLLEEVRTGQVRVTEVITREESPFAERLIWKQTNLHMYQDDSPGSGRSSGLSGGLLKEVLFTASLRPRIPGGLVEALESKLQRTATGYAPRSADDLLDWVKERLLVPLPEWEMLLAAAARDHELAGPEGLVSVCRKLNSIRLPDTSVRMVCALENIDRIAFAYGVPRSKLFDRLDVRNLFTNEGVKQAPVSFSTESGDVDSRGALADLFSEWLSYYGPVPRSHVKEMLGLSDAVIDDLLAGLVEGESVIVDLLTEEAEELEICDRENLEILLRMARRARQPVFKALPVDHLPLFLAAWQGLVAKGENDSDLQNRLDQLFGYPALADAWEKHIFPARLSPYYSAWLDSLLHTSRLVWFGCGRRKVSFCFADDLELFLDRPNGQESKEAKREDDKPDEEIGRFFPKKVGRYSLFEIAQAANLDTGFVSKKLWELVWQGRVANDTFAAVRQGVLTDFAPASLKDAHGRRMRPRHNRWGVVQPFPGSWYIVDMDGAERDPVEKAELIKDRVRQLLSRYGILFRELIANELPLLHWSAIFKALRLMELSGEILSGYFFEGIPGLQFISHEAFRFLNEPPPEDVVYWMNATDPASLSGVKLESLGQRLPSRISSTHIVYRGTKPVLVSRRNGIALTFYTQPDDPLIRDYLGFFKVLLARAFNPEKMIRVETINGRPALESDYAPALRAFGFTGGYNVLELVRKYH